MLNVTVRGKNQEVTEALRDLATRKLGRLDKYHEGLTEANVELTAEKAKNAEDRYHVDVSLLVSGTLLLHVEARAIDFRSAIDNVADVAQKQIVRRKERVQQRAQVAAARLANESDLIDERVVPERDTDAPVVETEQIELKPMSVDEAIDEMGLEKRDWLVFVNSDSNKVNVLERSVTDKGLYVLHVPASR